MWIEVEAEGEYLNADMIERVTVEDTTLTAHMPSGESIVDLDALDHRRRR